MKHRPGFLLRSCFFLGLLIAAANISLHAESPTEPKSDTPASSAEAAPAKTPDLFKALRAEKERLELENAVAAETFKARQRALEEERDRLVLELSLARNKWETEQAGQQTEIDKLIRQTELLARQLQLAETERKVENENALSELRGEVEKLKLENELGAAQIAAKQREILIQDAEVQLRQKELLVEKAELEMTLAKLSSEIQVRDKQDEWRSRVNRDIAYTKEPFQDGVLTISDRRIPLNGVITMDTADFVTERIDFFNNQNQEFPIFIVVDRSPGGSVMAGYKILKAMEGSPSPVYVVVKSFAASMAAGITTMAEKSFAYPNAIILHHQVLTLQFGNLTQQREQLSDLQQWWERVATPIAAKMGISLDEFIKQMYEARSTGDWMEFADSAQKLKWVDHIVETIREESIIKDPDLAKTGTLNPRVPLDEQMGDDGRRFVPLPRLDPVDAYYLYNPDDYFRVPR